MIGQTLLHYRILEKLGAGGMGEVYRAEDTTLGREVALKLLPEEFTSDPERLVRFEREAKTLAALDHPNIVTIHTIEEVHGVRFLTMELVRGKRLSELIPKGGMPLDRFFDIAVPLADALAAAHAQGVIHRDLKPANIMVSDRGQPKVLDFGLAKLHPASDEGLDRSRLATEAITEEGKIQGTVAYMSPVQGLGQPVDHRSDIFSLGVILYEMSTGSHPFPGDGPIAILSAITRDAPAPINELEPRLPRHLGRIVKHTLAKDLQTTLSVGPRPAKRPQRARGRDGFWGNGSSHRGGCTNSACLDEAPLCASRSLRDDRPGRGACSTDPAATGCRSGHGPSEVDHHAAHAPAGGGELSHFVTRR